MKTLRVLLTAVAAAMLFSAPALAQAPGTVDVYQDEVCDGGTVLITGSGWPASTFVHLRGDGEPLWGTVSGTNGNLAAWRALPAGTTPPNNFATVTAYVPQSPAPEDMVHTFVLIVEC